MNTDQLVAATGALREQRSLLELCAKLSGELASANVNFFAMELTEDRIQDFLDAAALRGPQVGTFVRQEVTKRFGTVAPSFVVNFVKPTPSDASSGPTLNSDYPLLPAGEVVPGADELLLDSERQQILTKLPISPAVGR